MNYLTRIVLGFFFLIPTVFAEQLEIKLNGKGVKLPYWAAFKNSHGAVLLINGAEKAQWSILLANLAKKLSTKGWSTVLLNCDQNDSESWIKEVPQAINALRQQKNNRVIVVHYGEQLQPTLEVLSKLPQAGIDGLVLLSAYDMPLKEEKKYELAMPLLDVTAQFDYEPVKEQAECREKEYAKYRYLSIKIPGAQHDYQYSRQLLLSFLTGWMHKLAEYQPIVPPVLVSYIESVAPLLPREVL